jgi:hypothetical protein
MTASNLFLYEEAERFETMAPHAVVARLLSG